MPRGISVCEGGMLRNDGYKKITPRGDFFNLFLFRRVLFQIWLRAVLKTV